MEAEPKSPSLTVPGSVSKMFPAFTSLRERDDQIRDHDWSVNSFSGSSLKNSSATSGSFRLPARTLVGIANAW
ncbi:hypothetical protein EYF80_025640 [Liparis tanakae]|uniref:Uncharacterized protein n=1 Tax=Liparis tanakae TaxID=230148 RepID=A0A4Z2HH14_9TELE|nr:hypothetical protein EYF80_025640 [Liparis tanakae]